MSLQDEEFNVLQEDAGEPGEHEEEHEDRLV
jgi:hypothetical protein